ncbi:MAG: creatininase [Actinobacteria bacterium]|nr:creatininase [Actinomycetota bacterium]
MTWPEVVEAAEQGYVPILVVGATEQHGPHLPLGSDWILPLEIAVGVAKRLKVLVPPPLMYGFKSKALSGGGQRFPGTASLRGSTLTALVHDVVSELARSGFRHLVVMNWHMENVNFIWEGIDLAREDGGLRDATVMSMDDPERAFDMREIETWMFDDGFPGWDVEHASTVETSLMLAVRPELVRNDLIADDAAEDHPWYDIVPEPERHVAKSGVLANASQASVEKGERYFEMIVTEVAAAIEREFGTERHG